MKTIKIDKEEYEVVSDKARILTSHLVDLFHRLGLPSDLTERDLNDVAWKFIDRLVEIWKISYPDEYFEWVKGLETELKFERPVRQAIKGGGYTPIAYPVRFFNLMGVFFPKLKLQNKTFVKKFVSRVPEFKHTNYKI